jgi:4-hydroxy-tetrahydrodipicolinate synthase
MFSSSSLSGAMTALVTPFSQDGESVDVGALDELIEGQIAAGITGLIPCGTTGESPTLSETELRLVIHRTAQLARGRVPVIAGAGSFSTQKTIHGCQAALEAGADGVLVVMPYYNRPSQAGLIEHVTQVAAQVKAPIVLYNIPHRTGVDLTAESTEIICARAPNVVAIKDATGNVVRCQEILLRLGERLTVMSGDDALTLPMMACGARGLISTTSNLLPKPVVELCRLALAGQWSEARRAHYALLPVFEAMFVEPSPAPVKYAMSLSTHTMSTVRAPLVTASESARAKVVAALQRFEAA